jgi:hypothetical protein
MNRILSTVVLFLLLLSSFLGHSQTFSDGPMRLVIRVNYAYICCYEDAIASQEIRWKFWARDDANWDGADWLGGQCIQADCYCTGWAGGPYGDAFWLLDRYYGANVPSRFDVYIDAHEEDGCGGNCDYNTAWYCDNDDAHCGGGEFGSDITYRTMGPPCQWNVPGTGVDVGACGWQYGAEFNTYWQYSENAAGATYIWKGHYSNNWNDACNWSTSTVPNSTKNVIIPPGYTYYPIIYNGVGAYANTIDVQSPSGAYLEIQPGGILYLTQ